MFDFAWSELMVIGAVALVVIGPKDLPKALKTVGIMVRRARGMAREFQNSIDDMVREADLDDVRKSLHEATHLDLDKTIHKTVDPEGELTQPLFPESPPPTPAAASDTPPPEAAPMPETAPAAEPAVPTPRIPAAP
ncbi:MAG: sec-independent protein translocase protein TatB [Aliidongia sp.]|jgi:sec-independent protein translocase protein TatB|nr:sec-independent protein translocase protein TatB [Aliidongia sp.]